MSTPVTLTEGVTSTLQVFGHLHNAFLSAAPSTTAQRVTTDTFTINKRQLKDFQDIFTKAIAQGKQMHEPTNPFKQALAVFEGHGGALLVSFAERWRKFASQKRTNPTKEEREAVSKDLADFDRLDLAHESGRISLLSRISGISQKPHWANYRNVLQVLEPILRAGVELHGRQPTLHQYDLLTHDRKMTINMEEHVIRGLLLEAKDAWEGRSVVPLDTGTATWVDFIDKSTELDISTGDFAQEKGAAENMLRSIDLFYTNSGLVQPFTAVLTGASAIADKLQEDLMRVTPPPPDATMLSDLMKKYAIALRNLVSEVQSADVLTRPAPWQSQFPALRDIGALSTKIASIWGGRATTMPIGWTRPLSKAFDSTSVYHDSVGATVVGSTTGHGLAPKTPAIGGALVRVIDLGRVKECTLLVMKFVTSIDDTDSKVMNRIHGNTGMSLAMIEKDITRLQGESLDESGPAIDGLKGQQVRVIRSFLKRARGVMTRQRDRHVSFALRHNRAPLRYMIYWRDCGMPGMKQHTKEYFDKLEDAIKRGWEEMDKITAPVDELIKGEKTFRDLSDTDADAIMQKYENIRSFKQICKDRISAVHTRPSTFLDQFVTDSHVHVIYILKLIRFALAWMATSIATKAFTSMYASNVYIKNIDPPSPSVYLAMFFGVNLALNCGLLTALWAANKVFKSPSNDFPIDSYLLTAWVVDAACSEIAMVAIGFAFASIIATKKAFRYRQEGDRGIRALGQMMLYSFAVMLCIPFFRVV